MDEIWKAFRNALLGDSTLVSLLGASDAIYFDEPRADLPFPCITVDIRSLNPQHQNGSFTGVWRPDLQFNLFGIDRFVLDRINARIVDAWTMPVNHTTPILSDSYQLTALRQLNAGHVGRVRGLASQADLRHFASEWRCRVSERTPPP